MINAHLDGHRRRPPCLQQALFSDPCQPKQTLGMGVTTYGVLRSMPVRHFGFFRSGLWVHLPDSLRCWGNFKPYRSDLPT